ncbi:MAG TPA: hypothetical protein VH593_06335 [Ktedonobacteraceae bacterium]
MSVTPWGIAPRVGFHGVNGRQNGDRVGGEFEESVKISLASFRLLVHQITDRLKLGFRLYFQSVNLHSPPEQFVMCYELAV